jgi:hypothetical protein
MDNEYRYSRKDMLRIELIDDDSFLKCKETLTRIGIASRKTKELFQSCHILHKQGLYYIVHFKELFYLDGRRTDIEYDDIKRRNTIARLLEEWELIKIPEVKTDLCNISHIKILSHKEKSEWKLTQKYTLGNNLRR